MCNDTSDNKWKASVSLASNGPLDTWNELLTAALHRPGLYLGTATQLKKSVDSWHEQNTLCMAGMACDVIGARA